MNRRWQKDGVGRYNSLQSFGSFVEQLPTLDKNLGIADLSDVYSTYSVLHAKSRNPRIAANKDLGFYYFLSDAPEPTSQQAQAAANPTTTEQGTHGLLGAHGQQQQQPAVAHVDCPAGTTAATPLTPGERRIEPVVPVGSKHTGLSLLRLRQLFQLEGSSGKHMLLAIVDDDGSVSLMRLFNYIQPPFEGPETLPPIMQNQDDDDSDVE